jgi:hypothetical protein
MTRKVRIITAALSAGIVLFGFGYVVVGRAYTTDAPAGAHAIHLDQTLPAADLAEVRVSAPRHRLPLSVWNQS